MVTETFPLGRTQDRPSLADYVVSPFASGIDAVSPPGQAAQEQRRTWRDRTSMSRQAYSLWQSIHDLIDEVDGDLLETLRTHPQIGNHILQVATALNDCFAEAVSLTVRSLKSEDDKDLSGPWMVVARVSLVPAEAFDRLKQFDEYWHSTWTGSSIDDVIATIEIA